MLESAKDLSLTDGTRVRLATGGRYQMLRFYRLNGTRGQYDEELTRPITKRSRFFSDTEVQALDKSGLIKAAIKKQLP